MSILPYLLIFIGFCIFLLSIFIVKIYNDQKIKKDWTYWCFIFVLFISGLFSFIFGFLII